MKELSASYKVNGWLMYLSELEHKISNVEKEIELLSSERAKKEATLKEMECVRLNLNKLIRDSKYDMEFIKSHKKQIEIEYTENTIRKLKRKARSLLNSANWFSDDYSLLKDEIVYQQQVLLSQNNFIRRMIEQSDIRRGAFDEKKRKISEVEAFEFETVKQEISQYTTLSNELTSSLKKYQTMFDNIKSSC